MHPRTCDWEPVEIEDFQVGDELSIGTNNKPPDTFSVKIESLNGNLISFSFVKDYLDRSKGYGNPLPESNKNMAFKLYGKYERWWRVVDELQYDPSQQLDLETDI